MLSCLAAPLCVLYAYCPQALASLPRKQTVLRSLLMWAVALGAACRAKATQPRAWGTWGMCGACITHFESARLPACT